MNYQLLLKFWTFDKHKFTHGCYMDPQFYSYFKNNLDDFAKTLEGIENLSHIDISKINHPLADVDIANLFDNMLDPETPSPTKTKAVSYPSYGQLKLKQGNESRPSSMPAISEQQLKTYQMRDTVVINQRSKEIIAGYLNLKETDGWKEGSTTQTGDAFTRFMLVRYFLIKKMDSKYHSTVIEKVINAYSFVGSYGDHFTEASYRPQKSHLCYDAAIAGWQRHKISRLIGNLGSTYDPSKPFFEILVNSQGTSTNSLCQAFFVSIYPNEKALDARRERLLSLSQTHQNEAINQFFDASLTKPDSFLKENKNRLGPNSTHLLEGLIFLQNKVIRAQKSGNCWMKQPMRSLLTCLFVEYHTDVKEITPEASWDQSKTVYKRMQKNVAIPHVTELLNSIEMTPLMRQRALQNIEMQKKL